MDIFMLPDDEKCQAAVDAAGEMQCAEISVRNPGIAFGHRRKHVFKERTLLGSSCGVR
jgi:hypothetical protein